MASWKPTASIENLKQRAIILHNIRHFFKSLNITEVQTPILSRATTTDIHIDSLSTHYQLPGETEKTEFFLQTSPEFAMKRLLAMQMGAIYQISPAFRDDPVSHVHNPEFALLEWYRPGFDHHQLMDEIDLFLQTILTLPKAKRSSYKAVFLLCLNIDPFRASITELANCAAEHQIQTNLSPSDTDRDTWLHLLMSHCIEPKIGFDSPLFITDYPVSQGGFASSNPDDPKTTQRFEVYVRGIELANGYHEITDSNEQKNRFLKDNQLRLHLNKSEIACDQHLLNALNYGLPNCAGVALGIDRLMMIGLNRGNIADVMAFPITHS